MNANEMKEKYAMLYDYMATSKDPKNMMLFGNVMTQMMDVMIQRMPQEAEQMIDKLESVKWKQYLTPTEAEKIVASMEPKAPWSRDVWKNAMNSLNLPLEEYPCYNSCAMWVTMNMVYTDHAETIARNIIKQPLSQIPTEQLVTGIHALALDLLKDKDGNFSIRRHYNL